MSFTPLRVRKNEQSSFLKVGALTSDLQGTSKAGGFCSEQMRDSIPYAVLPSTRRSTVLSMIIAIIVMMIPDNRPTRSPL